MATRSDEQAYAGAKRIEFERFVLDLNRGSLLLNDEEVPLRPKTFAVLQFLIQNAGQLISKDDIFNAVWPEVTVTDDVLVQSIVELRRALGADGARLIKTIPRRGYRFDASVRPSSHPSETSAAQSEPTGKAEAQCGDIRFRRSRASTAWIDVRKRLSRALGPRFQGVVGSLRSLPAVLVLVAATVAMAMWFGFGAQWGTIEWSRVQSVARRSSPEALAGLRLPSSPSRTTTTKRAAISRTG